MRLLIIWLFVFFFILLLWSCGSEFIIQEMEDDIIIIEEVVVEVGVVGEEVIYKIDMIMMIGYLFYDLLKEEKCFGVLVVYEWWGYNDYVCKCVDMLVEFGYVVLVVDMYGEGK